jgi:hypothetical protein
VAVAWSTVGATIEKRATWSAARSALPATQRRRRPDGDDVEPSHLPVDRERVAALVIVDRPAPATVHVDVDAPTFADHLLPTVHPARRSAGPSPLTRSTLPTFLPTSASESERSGNAVSHQLFEITRSRNVPSRPETPRIALTRAVGGATAAGEVSGE